MNCLNCRAGRLTLEDPRRALWTCPVCHQCFGMFKDEKPNPPEVPKA